MGNAQGIVRAVGLCLGGALAMGLTLPARADVSEPVRDDVIEAARALGPAATIAEACAMETESPRQAEESDEGFCAVEAKGKEAKKVKAALKAAKGKKRGPWPWEDLALVSRDSDGPAGTRLAMKVGGQWYAAWLATWSMDGADHGGFALKSIAIKDVVPGGAPEIVIVGRWDELGESHSYETHGTMRDGLWVCGVGASGAPSCAFVYLGESFTPHAYSASPSWKLRLSYKFDKQGRVVRKVKGKFPKDRRRDEGEDVADLPGRGAFENTRTLVFP